MYSLSQPPSQLTSFFFELQTICSLDIFCVDNNYLQFSLCEIYFLVPCKVESVVLILIEWFVFILLFFYRRFSKENFFDSNGLFISTVFSIPVLFNCICLIVSIFIIDSLYHYVRIQNTCQHKKLICIKTPWNAMALKTFVFVTLLVLHNAMWSSLTQSTWHVRTVEVRLYSSVFRQVSPGLIT